MSIDLSPLAGTPRLLFAVPLRPLQGQRFQPTGFPGLGAATFQTASGTSLLVESAQSMANRLESTCWNEAVNGLRPEFDGISHVVIKQRCAFLTDTILEAHRLNSPYLLGGKDKGFLDLLQKELGVLEAGPIDRRKLAATLLKYDIGSLLHGIFLAKKDLAGGRLRLARAMSAFIEADGVRVAASGGVKNDHVHPGKVEGDPKSHFGNIPFARDEYTADRITLYVNIDLGQIRGYGLGADVENLLTVLALYKLRLLLDGSLRLRTACDLEPATETIVATRPKDFVLPDSGALQAAVASAIFICKDKMIVTEVAFNDELNKAKESESSERAEVDSDDDGV